MGMRYAEARVQVEHLNTLGFSSCAAITTTAPGKRTRYMAIRRGARYIVCSAPDWDSVRGREDVQWWAQCGQWLGPLCRSPVAAYASGELLGWGVEYTLPSVDHAADALRYTQSLAKPEHAADAQRYTPLDRGQRGRY